jgi:hypothetical protein
MPDDNKITPPHAGTDKPTDTIQPNAELPRKDVVHLPTGYQTIHLRPLVPKPIADTHLVGNQMFQSSEPAGGCGKPISKIVTVIEETGSASKK